MSRWSKEKWKIKPFSNIIDEPLIEDSSIQHGIVHHAQPHVVEITEGDSWKRQLIYILTSYRSGDGVREILHCALVYLQGIIEFIHGLLYYIQGDQSYCPPLEIKDADKLMGKL